MGDLGWKINDHSFFQPEGGLFTWRMSHEKRRPIGPDINTETKIERIFCLFLLLPPFLRILNNFFCVIFTERKI